MDGGAQIIFLTVTLGERWVVVLVKCLAVWRFMDNGYGCNKLKNVVCNKYSSKTQSRSRTLLHC